MQQIRKMIPDFDITEGEEVQDCLLKLILEMTDNQTIENLYIDLKFIQEYVPEDQWSLEQFVPVTHLLASLQLILNDGVILENENQEIEEVEEDEDESDRNSSDKENEAIDYELYRLYKKEEFSNHIENPSIESRKKTTEEKMSGRASSNDYHLL